MSYSISEEKQLLRERIRALRQGLAPEKVREAGEAVARIILDRVSGTNTRIVCLYASTGKEVPTLGLMSDLIASGVTVTVPDWEAWKQGSGLKIAIIHSTDELIRTDRVVPQPVVASDRFLAPREVEMFLVPGIAFDRAGNRLGMGGGYFDRLLSQAASSAFFTGLAYDFQIVTHLPREAHDIPVHNIVTPGASLLREVDHKQEGKGYGS